LMKKEIQDEEIIFLINGDIYTETNFDQMAQFAKNSGADVVVWYVEKIYKSAFGVLEIKNDTIHGIIEKPETRHRISSGIYAIKGRALKNIPDEQFFTMPDLIHHYLKQNQKVAAYPIQEFWIGIENADNLDTALKQIEGQNAQ